MRFTGKYSKLRNIIFTTIRKNNFYYIPGRNYKINTTDDVFRARCIGAIGISREDITENLANYDADCGRDELIEKLNKWYGKEFDNYVLLTFLKY